MTWLADYLERLALFLAVTLYPILWILKRLHLQ